MGKEEKKRKNAEEYRWKDIREQRRGEREREKVCICVCVCRENFELEIRLEYKLKIKYGSKVYCNPKRNQ